MLHAPQKCFAKDEGREGGREDEDVSERQHRFRVVLQLDKFWKGKVEGECEQREDLTFPPPLGVFWWRSSY